MMAQAGDIQTEAIGLPSTMRPYPAYKPSGIEWLGDVPKNWEMVRIRGVVANVVDLTRKTYSDDIYLALEHVESWTGRFAVASDGVDFDSQVKRFRAGDVLFGKLRPYLAKVTCPNQNGVCVGEFLVFRPSMAGLSPKYLEQVLRSKPVVDAIDASTFGARMPRADWQFIGNLRLPLPPFPEQAAIVRFLDYEDGRIRRYIRAKERLIELLEEQKQAIIHQAVTGQIDVRSGQPYSAYKDSGVEWLAKVPEHWDVRRFRTLGSGFTNGTSAQQMERGVSGHRVSRIETISTGQVDYQRVGYLGDLTGIESYSLRPNDFLISHINSFDKVGNTARYRGEHPLVHGMNLIRVTPRNVVPKYLEYLLKTNVFIGSMRRACKPAINQVSVTTIAIKSITFPIPGFREQRAIVRFLDKATADIDNAISRNRRQIDLLQEYRTRLIADVVTGKIDVREAAARLPSTASFPLDGNGGIPPDNIDAKRATPLERGFHNSATTKR